MVKKLMVFAVLAALVIPFVGCSEDDDDPPPPAPFGPSVIAVGDDGTIVTSGDCQNWTEQTAPTGMDVLDLIKVVRIPNHALRRLVTFGDDSATSEDSEIWYSDDGGVNWLEATITELTGVRASTYFRIWDMHFINALEGIAVGSDGLVLFTQDAGENWAELNTWSDTSLTTNPGDQELSWWTVTPGTSGNPIAGTTITQDQNSGAPGTDYITADVVSWDPDNEWTVVTNISLNGAATAFNSTDTITWGTDGTGDLWTTPYEDDIWRYTIDGATCVYAVETAAASGTATTITVWLANDENDRYNGMWKLVSNEADPGAARTWTWTTPSETIQDDTTISDFSYDSVHRFFFFDASTGVAARYNNGIMTTEDGGATWSFDSSSDVTGSWSQRWSEFYYVNGFLHSITGNADIARIAVTYTSGGTPEYEFDDTNWWESNENGTGSYNDIYSPYYHTGVVVMGNLVYALAGESSAGIYSYGDTIGSVTFDDDVYSNTSGSYRGGDTLLGANPCEDYNVQNASGGSIDVDHWCGR
jgi:hypothetical protein